MNNRTVRASAAITAAIILMAMVFCAVGYVYVASQLHIFPFLPTNLQTSTFPTNPTIGQTFTYNGITYTWSGQQWNTPSGAAAPYAGLIKLYDPFYIFNATGIATNANNPDVILLHSDKLTMIGSDTGAVGYITGQLAISDAGTAYMLVGANGITTYGLLYNLITTQNPGVVVGAPTFFMFQNIYWAMYQLNLANLQYQGAGAGAPVTANIYGFVSVATPTLLSRQNDTALSATAFATATTIQYLGGWTGSGFGQGVKVTRLQFTVPDAGNATLLENNIQLKQVVVYFGNGVTQTYSAAQIYTVTGLGASDYIEVQAASSTYIGGNIYNQEFYGVPWLFGSSDSSTSLTVTSSWYGKLSNVNDTFMPSMKITVEDPTSSIATATHQIQIT